MWNEKKLYKQHTARAKQLPEGHRAALEAVRRYVWLFPSNRGGALMPLLDDLLVLFEESAENGVGVADIVGDDPVEFAEAFLRNYSQDLWLYRERDRLTNTIDTIARAERSEQPEEG
ncbi:DUF1048 domain-containing protein [Rhodococcus rhodnii]|nr:DUF1048 domain-containing protein [Rhodococcus rhodnii]